MDSCSRSTRMHLGRASIPLHESAVCDSLSGPERQMRKLRGYLMTCGAALDLLPGRFWTMTAL